MWRDRSNPARKALISLRLAKTTALNRVLRRVRWAVLLDADTRVCEPLDAALCALARPCGESGGVTSGAAACDARAAAGAAPGAGDVRALAAKVGDFGDKGSHVAFVPVPRDKEHAAGIVARLYGENATSARMPEPNTGVMLVRSAARTRGLLAEWRKHYARISAKASAPPRPQLDAQTLEGPLSLSLSLRRTF